ncbi:MAG TPA: EcsC family protein [Methylocystis sp.]|nr:EcsC family protein [Methylocystis sp.]
MTLTVSERRLCASDEAALEAAVAALERTSFAQRLTKVLGKRVALGGRLLPEKLQRAATLATHRALHGALRVALDSLKGKEIKDTRLRHRQLAMATGALGGAMGLPALPLELVVSTTIMLRAIADVARAEGENLANPEAAVACLEVFALGGHGEDGRIIDGGYIALRGALAKSVSDAASYLARGGAAMESAPALARFVAAISSRFGVVVSQKTAAQAAPLIGAASGALVNLAFTEHFQTLARGHFTVRRLERAYGVHEVRAEYARIARAAGYWPAAESE